MKREEHYCDRCGAQMTYQNSDCNQEWSGVKVKFKSNSGSEFAVENVILYLSRNNGCGTSSKAEYMHGREFCSFSCFESAVADWVERVRYFWK